MKLLFNDILQIKNSIILNELWYIFLTEGLNQ